MQSRRLPQKRGGRPIANCLLPGSGSLGGGIALFVLNFILAGIIGGFVLVWRLIVAVWYTFTLIPKLFGTKKGISNNDIVAYALIFAIPQLAVWLHFRHYHYV